MFSFYSVLKNKTHYLNDSNGKEEIITKNHLWISIWASGTQHIGSIHESEKKKEKKGTLSLNIKQGVIFSNQGTSKREGISENEAVSWTSQHLDPGLIPRAVTKEKYVPEPVFCKSRHVVYSIYTLLFWHIYLSWAKKQFSEELRKTCPWVAKKKEV